MNILNFDARKWESFASEIPDKETKLAFKALAAALKVCGDNSVDPYKAYYALLFMAMKSYWDDGQKHKLDQDIHNTAIGLWTEAPLLGKKTNA